MVLTTSPSNQRQRVEIKDHFYVDLAINGKPVYLNSNVIHELTVIDNSLVSLPTMQLVFENLSNNIYHEYPLNDGAIIDLSFGVSHPNAKPIYSKFRMLGAPHITPTSGGGSLVKIVGVLDRTKYWREIVPKAYRGNTSDVLNQVAIDSGLTVASDGIDQTNDTQVWPSNKRSYAQFSKHLEEHGYASDQSFMALSVNELGELSYKDLANRIKGQPTQHFYLGIKPQDGNGIEFYDHHIKLASGFMNNWINYGYNQYQEGPSGAPESFLDAFVTKLSNFLNINQSVKDAGVTKVRDDYVPIDCGNCHSKFTQARHQNLRVKATFATSVSIAIDTMSNVKLFDLVSLDLFDRSTGGSNQLYKGNYIVSAKTRTIRGNHYYERLELVSQGPQNDAGGTLI